LGESGDQIENTIKCKVGVFGRCSNLGASGDKLWHGFLVCLLNAEQLRKLLIVLRSTLKRVLGYLLVRKRGNAVPKFFKMARVTGGVWFALVVLAKSV
jgi:hypothetical protein